MKKLLLLASIIIQQSTTNYCKSQSFNPQLGSMLQDTLNTYVAAITNIKGMSAAVYLPGQGIWQGTAGVSYTGQPITSDMEFGIASNTKLFVSAAMLILEENHILSLDDSLSDWLPSYPNINPNITIRQLLNHTSGVQDPIFLSPWMDTIMANPTRVFTPTEVLTWVGTPLFAPGVSWSYSNVNYILAGMVAESATGMHISQIIRDSILTPLNLDSTFYDVEEPEFGTIAHRWYNTIDYNDTSRVGLNTAGGSAGSLFSNSGDMIKWYHAIMNGQLLSPASFAELTTFVPTGGAYTYGLGLENQTWFGHNTYAHGGSTWGYKSRMVYDPCMGAVVCGLVNSWPSGMDGIAILLYRVLVNHVPGCPGTITGTSSVCRGQTVTYTTTPIVHATTYVWTLPNGAIGTSNTNSITVTYGGAAVSGDITVRGNNQFGVGNVTTLPIIMNNVDVSTTTGNATIIANSAIGTYQWLDCNNGNSFIPGETNQLFTPFANGNFAVIITVNGCTDTSACVNFIGVGIADLTTEGLTISPNPFTSQTTIRFVKEQNNTTIKIVDVLGNEIKTLHISGKQCTIEKGEMSKGIYFIQIIEKGKSVMNKKIIVQE